MYNVLIACIRNEPRKQYYGAQAGYTTDIKIIAFI